MSDRPGPTRLATPDVAGHPARDGSPRTKRQVFVDAVAGLAQVGFGLLGGLMAVVLTVSMFGRMRSQDVPDEPFDRVARGVRRIVRGRPAAKKRPGPDPSE